jgi:hypothetical protein
LIVIVASRWDESARALALRWSDDDARVLTPRDLSRTGWRQRVGHPAGSIAVVDGDLVPQEEISAVLTRLPCVFEEELPHIAPEDRTYVAAEMTAFLIFWLAGLPCPVINRPTPGCLVGPAWRPAQWSQLAARAGFAAEPLHSHQPEQPIPAVDSLILAGDRCFGLADPVSQDRARRLAALAGVDLLSVQLSEARFLGVDLLPDLSSDVVAAAVLETLQCGSRAIR